MTPTFATSGSCFRACLATILDVPLDTVPRFRENAVDPYAVEVAARTWLREAHRLLLITSRFEGTRAAPGTQCVAVGVSPRDEAKMHAVVGRIDETGRHVKMVHDPHPDQTGIASSPVYLHFIVRLGD